MTPWLLALWLAAGLPEHPQPAGEITGVVVDGSTGRPVGAGVEVVLRVRVDGQYVVAATTGTDANGRFRFAPLPLREDLLYLPGANRGGVHFAGRGFRLSPDGPRRNVRLVVYPPVESPSPLVCRRFEARLRVQQGKLLVTERLLVDNPTRRCYVGQDRPDGSPGVTLRLHVPRQFERVTFHREFFGRRFRLDDGLLVTTVPWPPGRKELAYTYVLPVGAGQATWRRPLDLPSEQVVVRVEQPNGPVRCNLKAVETDGSDKLFQSDGGRLPEGFVVSVELAEVGVPWPWLARGLAVSLLVLLVGTTAWLLRKNPEPKKNRDRQNPSVRPASSKRK